MQQNKYKNKFISVFQENVNRTLNWRTTQTCTVTVRRSLGPPPARDPVTWLSAPPGPADSRPTPTHSTGTVRHATQPSFRSPCIFFEKYF